MIDPFARAYEVCNKCGGRLGLRTESHSNGTRTYQVCRKCNNQILTAQVNVIKDGKESSR